MLAFILDLCILVFGFPFLMVHELMHYIMMKLFKCEINFVTYDFNPLACLNKEPLWDFTIDYQGPAARWKRAIISLAPAIPGIICVYFSYTIFNGDNIDLYIWGFYLAFGAWVLKPSLADLYAIL